MRTTKESKKATKKAKAPKVEKLALADAIATVKAGQFANGMKAAIERVLHFAVLVQARREAREKARTSLHSGPVLCRPAPLFVCARLSRFPLWMSTVCGDLN